MGSVNWEKAWQDKIELESRSNAFWTKFTPKEHSNKISIHDEFHSKLIDKLILDENDRVLDLGCGSGTITVLISKLVNRVTAVDMSDIMLNNLKNSISLENIDNINILNSDIEDISIDLVDSHDVVLASRSLMGVYDIKNTLLNINEIAKKYVFIVIFGRKNWGLEKKFFKTVGRHYPDFPPYDYLFNLLISLKIYPNIENFNLSCSRQYDDIDDAFNRMKWRKDLLTPEEITKIKPFLEKHLIKNENTGKLESNLDKSDIILMWWKKETI
ncbi:class I SAM-dependent methyltransferase [Methanobrevibacter filiformis]|uniref:Ubiquinone/menaquinone biosynthesis C-methyltransferase UbiE n=1 Tax=Methanobrevibacter filiformis TaxID=55758 RepID=A0A166AL62_9EURY|nr:class I SAM-dependent methyltransferase [Methanobrevibacter filiformis]KZX12179.1 ubiquinone/menaquinone biosynthesis C-methyltransferase UbiE [Methanobrevibacter filiformis]